MTIAALVAATLTATGAGAATLHHFAVTSGTGDGKFGANSLLNTSPTGATLEAVVGPQLDSAVPQPYAIFGEYDASQTQFGFGVAGVSTTGYGVAAEATGQNAAMFGIGTGSGPGMLLQANTGDGLDVTSGGNNAISAIASTGVGVYAQSNADGQTAVLGVDSGNSAAGAGFTGESNVGVGIAGSSTSGIGLSAVAGSGGATSPVIAATSTTVGTDLIDGYTQPDFTPFLTFEVQGSSANRSGHVSTSNAASDVQIQGDLYLTGKIYTSCNAYPAVTSTTCNAPSGQAVARTSGGTMLQTYESRHALPTMEDEGEAQLVNGAAHVALDPAFASTISNASPYLVFTTPGGETRGLYVTHKTLGGFDVREIAGGRSNVTFDYRIVARPYADRSTRLALVHAEPVALHNAFARPFPRPRDRFHPRVMRHLQPFVSPASLRK